jgi:hypothetical protein
VGDLVLRPYQPGDEAAINDGFNRVFGLDRPLSEWHWKYPVEPEGRWLMLACDEGGTLLAHYGAVPVRLRIGAREVRAGQIGDVYTVPETRHGLGAARTYIQTVKAFFAEFGAPEKLAVLYGFPGERALRLGLARLGYDQMPPRPVPVWRRQVSRRGRIWTGHDVRAGFDPVAADALWRQAGERYRVAAVRGAAWLARRFTGRPGVEYIHLRADRRGQVSALAVLRVMGKVARWCDLVWDGGDPRALAALDKAAASIARSRDALEIEMWLDGDDAAARVFSDLGWVCGCHPAGLVMVARSFHPEIDVASFPGAFYLTMGDADLI